MKKDNIKYLNELDNSNYYKNKFEKSKKYIEELIEAYKEITDNEFIYSSKFGERQLEEIKNFIK